MKFLNCVIFFLIPKGALLCSRCCFVLPLSLSCEGCDLSVLVFSFDGPIDGLFSFVSSLGLRSTCQETTWRVRPMSGAMPWSALCAGSFADNRWMPPQDVSLWIRNTWEAVFDATSIDRGQEEQATSDSSRNGGGQGIYYGSLGADITKRLISFLSPNASFQILIQSKNLHLPLQR